jgi:hypothetical protein
VVDFITEENRQVPKTVSTESGIEIGSEQIVEHIGRVTEIVDFAVAVIG